MDDRQNDKLDSLLKKRFRSQATQDRCLENDELIEAASLAFGAYSSRIARHLQLCPECFREVMEMKLIAEQANRESIQPPASMSAKLNLVRFLQIEPTLRVVIRLKNSLLELVESNGLLIESLIPEINYRGSQSDRGDYLEIQHQFESLKAKVRAIPISEGHINLEICLSDPGELSPGKYYIALLDRDREVEAKYARECVTFEYIPRGDYELMIRRDYELLGRIRLEIK